MEQAQLSSADNLVQAIADGADGSLIQPKLSAIRSELDELALEVERLREQRRQRKISLTKDDVLDALREVERLLADARPSPRAKPS
ncbi:MAG: hypothetical protein WEE64_03195 [Dehalococcoidia bacterium]